MATFCNPSSEMSKIEEHLSNDIDGIPGDILVDMYCCCNCGNDTKLDDCSMDLLPSLDPSSPIRKISRFSDLQEEAYSNSDEIKRSAEDAPSTPNKRKREEENFDELSLHSFSSPMKTPSLPPKKAIKLPIATPSTDEDATVSECGKDDDFHDPLLIMPLFETLSGFETLLRPNNIKHRAPEAKAVVAKTEKSAFDTPLRTPGRMILCHPGAPNMAAELASTTSKKGQDQDTLAFPEFEIRRQKAVFPHDDTPTDSSVRKLLFPPLDASPLVDQPFLANRSKFVFQLAPRSNQSNPSNPNPSLPVLKKQPSLFFDSFSAFKPVSPANPRTPRDYIFRPLAGVGSTPQDLPSDKIDRPLVAVTPEQEQEMTVAEKPKLESKQRRPRKTTPTSTSKHRRLKKQATKPAQPKKTKKQTVYPVVAITPEETTSNRERTKSKLTRKQEGKWNRRYEEVKAFIKKHGHGLIPNRYEANPQLGGWAKRQRYQYQVFVNQREINYSNGKPMASMSNERVEMLDKIGFCWQHKKNHWNKQFQDLEQFVKEVGHALVPTTFEDNPALAGWVKVQRRQYKLFTQGEKSSMTQDRIDRLNKLGFRWSVRFDLDPLQNVPKLEDPSRPDSQPSNDKVLDADKVLTGDGKN